MSGAQFQMLLAQGTHKATATFVAHSGVISASGTSHTISIDCGAGGNVVACVYTNANSLFSSVTIGGVSATINVQKQQGGSNSPVAICSVAGCPPGVQNVVLTVGSTGSLWDCQTFTLAGIGSLTPTATGGASNTLGGESGTLSNVANGCTIGFAACDNGASPVTWTGLTKDAEDDFSSLAAAAAHMNWTNANSALSWSTSFGGSNDQTAAVWASWGP